jgi:membrane-associated protease RseP (regulator of RpoE activity)
MDNEPYDPRSAEPTADARQRPVLGVAFRSQGEALVIEHVAPNSPAARMGLRQADRIVALDGKIVRDRNAFTSAVSKIPLDERVELTYLRNGRLLTQDVQFAAWDSVYAEGNGVAEPQRVYRPDFDQDQPAMPQQDEFPEVIPVPPDPYVLPPWRFDDDWDDDD